MTNIRIQKTFDQLYPSSQDFKETLKSISHSKFGKVLYVDPRGKLTETQNIFQTLFEKFKGLTHLGRDGTNSQLVEDTVIRFLEEGKNHDWMGSLDDEVIDLGKRIGFNAHPKLYETILRVTIKAFPSTFQNSVEEERDNAETDDNGKETSTSADTKDESHTQEHENETENCENVLQSSVDQRPLEIVPFDISRSTQTKVQENLSLKKNESSPKTSSLEKSHLITKLGLETLSLFGSALVAGTYYASNFSNDISNDFSSFQDRWIPTESSLLQTSLYDTLQVKQESAFIETVGIMAITTIGLCAIGGLITWLKNAKVRESTLDNLKKTKLPLVTRRDLQVRTILDGKEEIPISTPPIIPTTSFTQVQPIPESNNQQNDDLDDKSLLVATVTKIDRIEQDAEVSIKGLNEIQKIDSLKEEVLSWVVEEPSQSKTAILDGKEEMPISTPSNIPTNSFTQVQPILESNELLDATPLKTTQEKELAKVIFLLVENQNTSKQTEEIFSLLKDLSLEESSNLISCWKRIKELLNCSEFDDDYLVAFESSIAVKVTKIYLLENPKIENFREILEILKNTLEGIEELQPFFAYIDITNPEEVRNTLEIRPFLNIFPHSVIDKRFIYFFNSVRGIREIPEKEKTITLIKSLLDQLEPQYSLEASTIRAYFDVIKNFSKLSTKKRESISPILRSFCKSLKSFYDKKKNLHDSDFEFENTLFGENFRDQIFNGFLESCNFLLEFYEIIPFDQQQFNQEFIEHWYLTAINDEKLLIAHQLYKGLQIIPEEDRFSVLKEIIFSRKNWKIKTILSQIKDHPKFLEYLEQHLDEIDPNSNNEYLGLLINALDKLNILVDEKIFNQILKLSSDLQKKSQNELIEIVKFFNHRERTFIIDFIKAHSDRDENKNLSLKCAKNIFKVCTSIPVPLERLNEEKKMITEWLEVLQEWESKDSKSNKSWKSWSYSLFYGDVFFPYLNLIAPEYRFEAFQRTTSKDQWLELFKEDKIRESSFQYLRNFLKQDFGDVPRERIIPLLTVLINEERLQFPRDILDEAVELMVALANPSSLKDPIRIYNALKQFHKNEKLLEIESPVCWIERNNVRFNLNTLRTKTIQLTREDLPADINDQTLKDVFDQWKGRFDTLSPNDQEEIKNIINNSILLSPNIHVIEELKNVIFSLVEIQRLFSLAKDPIEIVDNLLYYLYMSIKAIHEEKTDPQKDSLLTPQEDKLLRLCIQIGFEKKHPKCSTGQKDGLSDFYNTLSPEYRIKRVKGYSSNESKIEDFVFSIMNSALDLILAKESVLQKLMGKTEAISQQSHQTIFLKNILYNQLAMSHQLTFDRYTGMLHDELLRLIPENDDSPNLKKALEIILQDLTLNVLDRLNHDISQELTRAKRIEFDLLTATNDLEKLDPNAQEKHKLLEQRRLQGPRSQQDIVEKEWEPQQAQPSQEICLVKSGKQEADIENIHHKKWLEQRQAESQQEKTKEIKEDLVSTPIMIAKKYIQSLQELKKSFIITYTSLKGYISARDKNFKDNDYFIYEEGNEKMGPIAMTPHGIISLLKWTGYLQDAD